MRELTTYEQWDLYLRIAAKRWPRPEDDEEPEPPDARPPDARD